MSCGDCRHADFEKIYSAFLTHYSNDPKLGESRYADWVKVSGLDETQSYYAQGAARAKSKQSFEWANFLLQFVKEDQDARYYKVEALFPVESMNGDVFTKDEVLQAARSLTGKPNNLNHDPMQMLKDVEVVAAQFEDDCVECLVRILKASSVIGMIDRKEIVSVSIEGDWSHGIPGHGLVLTGLAWLTKDKKLPGIPLTRITPVEHIVESFVIISNGVEKLEEKETNELAERVAAKIDEKQTVEIEKLKTEVTNAKSKLSEAEGKQKTAETALGSATTELGVAKKTIEDLHKQLPGGGLLKDPPVMMQLTEHVAVLEGLLPPAMVERSSMGMQRQCQTIRSAILKAKEKLKAK